MTRQLILETLLSSITEKCLLLILFAPVVSDPGLLLSIVHVITVMLKSELAVCCGSKGMLLLLLNSIKARCGPLAGP